MLQSQSRQSGLGRPTRGAMRGPCSEPYNVPSSTHGPAHLCKSMLTAPMMRMSVCSFVISPPGRRRQQSFAAGDWTEFAGQNLPTLRVVAHAMCHQIEALGLTGGGAVLSGECKPRIRTCQGLVATTRNLGSQHTETTKDQGMCCVIVLWRARRLLSKRRRCACETIR